MEGTMAVVTMVAYDFTPRNWGACDGQLLSIAQNTALFSLLGTTYGGNGIQTFGLPDLRGRVATGCGQGAGLSNYTLGEIGGTENTTLNVNNLPPHAHNGPINITPVGGLAQDSSDPGGYNPGSIPNGYASASTAGVSMVTPSYTGSAIGVTGSSQPMSLLTPYLTVNFVICMYGIFPSRN